MEIIQLLFVHLCCIFYVVFSVLYLFCCIKITSLSETAPSSIFWEYFGSDSKEDSFYELSNLGLMNYLVILLCLFQNHLSVSKLNFMLLFLLILLISNLLRYRII